MFAREEFLEPFTGYEGSLEHQLNLTTFHGLLMDATTWGMPAGSTVEVNSSLHPLGAPDTTICRRDDHA